MSYFSLMKNFLRELRIEIEVAGAAENAGAGLAEIRLDGRRDARGRIIGFELAGSEARRRAGAMDRSASRLDIGVDDGCQRNVPLNPPPELICACDLAIGG